MHIEQATDILGALAFAMLIAAQFTAIITIRTVDLDPTSGARRASRLFHFGNLARHRERALILRRVYLSGLLKGFVGRLRPR